MPLLRPGALRDGYAQARFSPLDVAHEVLRRLAQRGQDHVWIARAGHSDLLAQAQALAARRHEIDRLPLYGLPFGVKDNVDVAGIPTTCGCPGYARVPDVSAAAVQRALDAGALFIGKQTLDQFATGLNGTRTLGGHCLNVFDPEVIPGGSSSGSGVAVAAGLVSFSLGSDTGGSGRVPAALNNIVGLRPSIGRVSSRGMVYNNRLFDCVPVFAPTVEDAFTVLEAIAGFDADDPMARDPGTLATLATLAADFPAHFRFAVPTPLEFHGDRESADAFETAVAVLRALGGTEVPFDFAPFTAAGQLIFDSALVAERATSYGDVLQRCPEEVVAPVARILDRASRYTAVDAFRAQYRMSELRRQVAQQLDGIDVLVTPTVPRPYRVAEMRTEPLLRNAEVGHYTYGVGPLDLCALALPASIRTDGLPFGISLVGRAGEEGRLRALGGRFEQAVGLPPGIEALR
jgi:allophanate hydrolase